MTSIAHEAWFRDPLLARILSLLNDGEGETRIVGGAVRNSLLGLPVSDIDLATSLKPERVMEKAAAAGIKAVPTGLAHGTVTLVAEGRPFEVTTLRRDEETDGRHAKIAFTEDWEEDARRRDLTINALYADRAGTVVDHVEGLKDIESRTIRFIGAAAERIAEDHLRILRFFRFFAHYGSGRPDAEGMRACAAARSKLSTLSAERVWSELKKLLSAEDPGRALLWMRQIGVLTEILPESEKWGIDAIPGLVATERALGWTPDPLLRLVAMIPPDAERVKAMGERLRLSKAEAASLSAWAEAEAVDDAMSNGALAKRLYREGVAGIAARLRLALALARSKAEGDLEEMARAARLGSLLERTLAWVRPQFPLSGADVLAMGLAPGPLVGALLSAVEEEWINQGFRPDRAALLERLRERAGRTG